MRSEAGPEWPGRRFFTKGIRKLQYHRGPVEKRNISDRSAEKIAHLIAHKLNQAFFIELRGKRLSDAVDRNQLRCTFADLVLPLIDRLICARIVECDGRIRGEILKQAKMLLRVGILLEALNTEHSKNPFLRDERQINHGGRRLRHAAVHERPARMFVGRNIF